MKDYLEIGKITSARGLKGEVKVVPWCDNPSFFSQFDYMYVDEKKIKIDSFYINKNTVVIKFENVNARKDAELLKNKVLYISRDDVKLDRDTYFLQDVIGSKVLDADTKFEYGKVRDIFKTGANDIYEIIDENNKVYLVPAIEKVIVDINTDKKLVLMRPLKGIFNDEN